MHSATAALTSSLDRELRQRIEKRIEGLQRHLRYLDEKQHRGLAELRLMNWSDERLEVVFSLNAFYQTVLGPLTVATRFRQTRLGNQIPIRYGDALLFDRKRGAQLQAADTAFANLLSKLGLGLRVMTAQHADDVVQALLFQKRIV